MANRYTGAEIEQIKADNHVRQIYEREGFRIAHKAQANGQTEYHGPCPSCGGTDRFILYEADNSFWCRKCAVSGDPIALVRLVHGLGGFREAPRRVRAVTAGASPTAGRTATGTQKGGEAQKNPCGNQGDPGGEKAIERGGL